MPFANINYQLVIFEDQTDRNPQIRMPDITKSIQGVNVNHDKSERITLAPGETKDIVVTSRAVAWDATTQLTTDRYLAAADGVRLKWTGTGTAPAFRTNRNIGGGATTVVDMTRISPYVVRITQSAGTAWTLGSVQNGDIIKFEKNTDTFTSPFNPTNLGKSFSVQAKGANYIDFVDNGTAALDTAVTIGTDFAFALRVFSNGPVKIGDTLTISGAGINPSNHGKFEIVDLSTDYIEIINPFSEPETFLYGTNAITVYDYLIGLLHLRASGPVRVKYDNQVEWMLLDRLGAEVILLASVCSYRIQANNNDPSQEIEISVQHARVIG